MHHVCSFNHLLNLVCTAAQREIGETALNEESSRSHQILRLVGGSLIYLFYTTLVDPPAKKKMILLTSFCYIQTIESSVKQYLGRSKSSTLVSCVVRNVFLYSWLFGTSMFPSSLRFFFWTELCWPSWKWASISDCFSWYEVKRR